MTTIPEQRKNRPDCRIRPLFASARKLRGVVGGAVCSPIRHLINFCLEQAMNGASVVRGIRVAVAASIAGCLAAALPLSASAQACPAGALTLVVPFPAGSTTDSVGRKMAEFMRARSGNPVVVENRAGADGNIGAQAVLRAPADGCTALLTGNSVHGANANLYRELPFDPLRDFEMVGGVMTIPMVLTVRPDFPARNVEEFVAEAKRRTKPLIYATGNNSTHGATELFKARYTIQADHVPYRGSPQVVSDLVGGQFDFAFIDARTVRSFVQNGRLKALASTSVARLASLPDVPTVAERLPGFQFGAWVGVVVRSGTPAEARAQLSQLTAAFVADPASVTFLESIDSAPMPMNPAELRTFVESETRTWAEIVRLAGIAKK